MANKKPDVVPDPPHPLPRTKKHRQGPAGGVPCPWCGERDDWRPAMETGQVQPNHYVTCEYCGNICVIVAIKRMPIVELKQFHGEESEIDGF